MATAKVRSGGFEMHLDLQGFDFAERNFRQVRNELARSTDEESRAAAEVTILPEARRRAGRLKVEGQSIGASLVVRRIRGGARLTSNLRGRRARAVGLLEFGGTVRVPIVPKNKKALMIRGGTHPVSRVRTARHYRAHKFLYGAKDAKLDSFGENLRDRLVEFFRRAGFEVV